MAESHQRWLALESNPDVMNKYVHDLGVDKAWGFTDVLGFDEELLGFVPQPVAAVVFLFPYTDKVKENPAGKEDADAKLYFTKQTIPNACGTIGIIHSLANNMDRIPIDAAKHFKKLYEDTKDLSPAEKAKYLETDDELAKAHDTSATEGQTKAPAREETVKNHFIAFVHNNKGLYELDGCRGAPVSHGNTTPEHLLRDAGKVITEYMKRDPDSGKFCSVIALCKID